MTNCKDCKHYQEAMFFELCKHDKSIYQVADKKDYHTIGHMRKYTCTVDALLYEYKK